MKKLLSLLLCVTIMLSLAACGSDNRRREKEKNQDNHTTEVSDASGHVFGGEKEKTINFKNDDTVYHPAVEHIRFDENANVAFFDNLLIVYTLEDMDKDEAGRLAALVDGTVVGDISGAINVVQIQVRKSSLEELNEKAALLMQTENVLYAAYDYPMEIHNSNSWSEDKNSPETDVGNEAHPSGNDWWAEAVGAYTAWGYANAQAHIKVGVLDSGFDVDHEDLRDKISFLPAYPDNSEDDHGTHVAGIIAAKDNDVGIRGIANGAELICVDWSPVTNDAKREDYVNYLSTGEYVEIIKQLVENDVRVINNSWGSLVYSKEKFTEALYGKTNDLMFLLEYFAVHTTGAYESYLRYVDAVSMRTAVDSMLLIIQLLLNDEKDFLIVQSAGNGYDNGGKGFDTSRNGFFCAIDEQCYNLLSDTSRERLSADDITYDVIDQHIMIVGAIQNAKNKNNQYKLTSFSNFGENIDICAPGQSIYSTVSANGYGAMDGTSMAAPVVAGSAALLWSAHADWTAAKVKRTLIETSVEQAVGVQKGDNRIYPIVHIGNALRQTQTIDDRILGTYTGSYFESQGETGLTLTVYKEKDKYKATFDFYNLPGRNNAKSGKYYMDVSYDANTEEYIFTATDWIEQPTSYYLVDLKGKLNDNVLSGTSPTRFSLTRITANNYPAQYVGRTFKELKAALGSDYTYTSLGNGIFEVEFKGVPFSFEFFSGDFFMTALPSDTFLDNVVLDRIKVETEKSIKLVPNTTYTNLESYNSITGKTANTEFYEDGLYGETLYVKANDVTLVYVWQGYTTRDTIADFVYVYHAVEEQSIPSDAFEYNGHHYKIYSNVCNTWEEARSYCESLSGHLAVISSQEENDALFGYLTESGYTTAYFGFYQNQSGEWEWVTSETNTYTNWHEGEPSHDANEKYAEFYWKFADGTWNDGNFDSGTQSDTRNFICEWW